MNPVESQPIASVADVRRAWFRAVATQQAAAYIERIKESADTRVEFARRLRAAGNWSALDYMRQQVFYAELIGRIVAARRTASHERERLEGLPRGDAVRELGRVCPDRQGPGT